MKRPLNGLQIDHQVHEMLSVGEDCGRGNVVGVQAEVSPWDYTGEDRFFAKLAGYLDLARRQGWLSSRTTVVFPEHIGTWLVAAGERPSVCQARTINRAMRALVLRNPFSFLRTWLSSGLRANVTDKITYSVFQLKARRMAEIYHSSFSRLARKFQITVVAGSIVLPSPKVTLGVLHIGAGALYNCCPVYRPDGSAEDRVVRKVFPISAETPFTSGAPLSTLPVFETPAGRMAVLICADSWYPSAYQIIRSASPDLVVVPSYLSPDGIWSALWRGYDGAPAPEDVDSADIGRLTEGEAWLKYALAGRLSGSGARWGMNVFLRGRIWDLGSDGRTIMVCSDQISLGQPVPGAALFNLWLDSPTIANRRAT